MLQRAINDSPSSELRILLNAIQLSIDFDNLSNNMVQQIGLMKPEDWECYLIKVGISVDSAKLHATTFTNEKLMRESL